MKPHFLAFLLPLFLFLGLLILDAVDGLVVYKTNLPLAALGKKSGVAVVKAHRALALEATPLIGGPSWLPLHVKVVLTTETSSRYEWDFIPVKARDPATLNRILKLQYVPGLVRTKFNRQKPDWKTKLDALTLSAESKDLVELATAFSSSYDASRLHLITNNCWTFALQLYVKLLLENW